MRRIIVGEFITLDGVVESPENWNFPYFNDEMGQAVGSLMAAADTLLLGRVTYQTFAGAFSGAGSEDPVAAQMNSVDKVVVSTTLPSADWENSTLISDNVVREIKKLKKRRGKDIAVNGSITLVQSLLREGLVDELNLLVHPTAVGTGRRLFEEGVEQIPLKLVSSATFSTGVLHVVYQVV